MGNKPTLKGEIVKEYLAKFPNLPSLSLAKKIYNETHTGQNNRLLFKDIEAVRGVIRTYRGVKGRKNRQKAANKENFIEPDKFRTFAIPESAAEEPKVYKMPLANNNILVISDLHIPYHDKKAVELALQYGLDNKVNTIIINGDLIDFHHASRFQHDPRKRDTKYEFDCTRQFLKSLRGLFPTQKIVYLLGNHCVRWEKYLMTKAPEIFNDSYFSLEARLGLAELKIECLTDDTLIKAGKLNITHGHHVIKGVFAPVNPARGAFMKTKACTLIGHCHQVSQHTETTLNGDLIGTYSTGCLCELHPQYSPFNTTHSHGFAHLIIQKSGSFKVSNKHIFKGEIL